MTGCALCESDNNSGNGYNRQKKHGSDKARIRGTPKPDADRMLGATDLAARSVLVLLLAASHYLSALAVSDGSGSRGTAGKDVPRPHKKRAGQAADSFLK